MKEILFNLISEVEENRALLSVVARQVPDALTLGEAREAKSLALQENKVFFDKLRKQVEDMP